MGVFEDHEKNYGDYEQRANSRAGKYNKTVQQAYQKYRNRVSPMQAEKYQNEVGKMQKVYVKSNFETNYRKMGESGNVDGMGVLLESAKILFPKPEWDDLNANIANDSFIWQADKSMDMEDYDNALITLKQVDKGKLSDSRREAYSVLEARATERKIAQSKAITSDMIIKQANGDLTVEELKSNAYKMDAKEYKSILADMTRTTPEESKISSVSAVNDAIADLQAEQITREQAYTVYLDNQRYLKQEDRSKFVIDIEEKFAGGIGKAKSVVKTQGKGLISPRFRDVNPITGMPSTGFQTPEDERRYDLEWKNKNQYDAAVDKAVSALGNKAVMPLDIRRIGAELYVEFEESKKLELDKLEQVVRGRTNLLISGGSTKTEEGLKKAKSLSELEAERESLKPENMTEAQKRARIAELDRKRNQ